MKRRIFLGALGREMTFLGLMLVSFAIWVMLPTGLFLRPLSLEVRAGPAGGYQAAFARETPFGAVRASWHTEIQSLSECEQSGTGLTYYEARGTRVVPYDLSARLAACIVPGVPFAVVTWRQAYVLGVVPLRPSQTVFFCRHLGAPCVQSAIDARGQRA